MSKKGFIGGYPAYMRESIEKVEATRSRRLKEGPPPPMSPEEREAILERNHPDYKPEGKRKLAVGPSAGEMYCTQPCENEGMCPEDYRCTVDCDVSSDQPYCVTKEDYDHLFVSGRCQAP